MCSSADQNHGRPTRERARLAVQRSARELEAESAIRAIFLGALVAVVLGVAVAGALAGLVIFAPTDTEAP